MRKALPTRGSGPPSEAACWTVLITHAKTCAKAEGLDGRPSDNREGADDHRPPINRERGGQEIGDTICERSQSAGGIFHLVDAVQHIGRGAHGRCSDAGTGTADGNWKLGDDWKRTDMRSRLSGWLATNSSKS